MIYVKVLFAGEEKNTGKTTGKTNQANKSLSKQTWANNPNHQILDTFFINK